MAEEESVVNAEDVANNVNETDAISETTMDAINGTKLTFIVLMFVCIAIGILANILYIMEYTMRMSVNRHSRRLFNHLMIYLASYDFAYLLTYVCYLISNNYSIILKI